MNRHLCACLLLLTIATSAIARADNDVNNDMYPATDDPFKLERIVPNDDHYPTSLRATLLGEISLQTSSPRKPAGGAQATIEFGKGLISAEAGLAYVSTQTKLEVVDSGTGSSKPYTMTSNFVGVPLLLKINYIERPQASFSVKVGLMPVVSIKDTANMDVGDSLGKRYNLSRNDTFGVLGFTGAAPLDEKSEFIMDASYNQGLTKLDGPSKHRSFLAIGIGVRFDL